MVGLSVQIFLPSSGLSMTLEFRVPLASGTNRCPAVELRDLNPDPLDANEAATVGQRGSLWPDDS